MMSNFSLKALSPIDGRYHKSTKPLNEYLSEYGLFKYRILVEIEYFIAFSKLNLFNHNFTENQYKKLRNIYNNFELEDAKKIKTLEHTTNHDIKAVEYFLKEQFDLMGLSDYKEYIHLGLTSQDINNTAIPLSLKNTLENIFLPQLHDVLAVIKQISSQWKEVVMLAKTHGQPASPTRLGKELFVFYERLNNQINLLKKIPFSAKFGGATGNFNAHYVAYPTIDWVAFANTFIEKNLGLHRSKTTTQIDHYDHLAALFDNLKRINTILIDFCQDIWLYISAQYFVQSINEKEVGSSAMPHKVNPIDFENAEGNLGLANAIYNHFSTKLPISRLQRDLSDSTLLRNISLPIAHSMIAFTSLKKGLKKLKVNQQIINKDLEANWSVVTEGIQTILRREGFPKPYETLKNFARKNTKISKKEITTFIDSLDIDEKIKKELKSITPYNYVGIKI